jgi:hypothetical protein
MMIDLNDLLAKSGIKPEQVLVMRHSPTEPKLRRAIRHLAANKPDVYNAYQQTQSKRVELAMGKAAYVASFIGHAPAKALYVGLYAVGKSHPLTREEFWQVEAYAEMKTKYDMKGFAEEDERASVLWFDLTLTDICAALKGKLIIGWPAPEVSWSRWAHRNTMPILLGSLYAQRSWPFPAGHPHWERGQQYFDS